MRSRPLHPRLAALGRQVGRLELPRSTNTSGWSHLFIPIATVGNGDGPTVVALAGNHGDEYEGQIAALKLLRHLDEDDVSGRVIIIPCLSPQASSSGTRRSGRRGEIQPLVPGQARRSAERATGPLPDDGAHADVRRRDRHPHRREVCSLRPVLPHALGREARATARKMARGMLAWNTDFHFIYIDIAGSGLLPNEAESQGKTVITTELSAAGLSR